MNNTIKNLKDNKKICVIGNYFRVKGKAEIFHVGRYFDLCVKENKDYRVKNAILVTVKEVFDLGKVKKIAIKN
jgi:hypothetical protein